MPTSCGRHTPDPVRGPPGSPTLGLSGYQPERAFGVAAPWTSTAGARGRGNDLQHRRLVGESNPSRPCATSRRPPQRTYEAASRPCRNRTHHGRIWNPTCAQRPTYQGPMSRPSFEWVATASDLSGHPRASTSSSSPSLATAAGLAPASIRLTAGRFDSFSLAVMVGARATGPPSTKSLFSCQRSGRTTPIERTRCAARTEGLEPPTSGVRNRCSSCLSYVRWIQRESNPRPSE